MTLPQVLPSTRSTTIRVHDGRELDEALPRLVAWLLRRGPLLPLSRHPAWLRVLEHGLGHTPYCLEAVEEDRTKGFLALAYVRSLLFGRFLVSLPYLNYGGVETDDPEAARLLIDQAAGLADRLDVRYLELRHEYAVAHPAFGEVRTDKVHMRLDLPAKPGQLWSDLDPKVRNQVRKGQKNGLTVSWGGAELLADFYAVFSRNMRDLGTPVYGQRLFREVLANFPDRAEFCVVRTGRLPVAAALLLHGWGVAHATTVA
jgi:FemAB-related protein (PEP-CTERM system-associated)